MRRKKHSRLKKTFHPHLGSHRFGKPLPSFEMAGTVQFFTANSPFPVSFPPCLHQECVPVISLLSSALQEKQPKNLQGESNLFILMLSKYFLLGL